MCKGDKFSQFMSSWVKILNKKKTKQTKLLTLDLIALLNQNYCHKPQNCSPSARSYRQRKVKTPFPTHPILPKLPCTRALYLQGNAMQHSTEKKTKKKTVCWWSTGNVGHKYPSWKFTSFKRKRKSSQWNVLFH